jgi:hypothetical protein
MSGQCLHVHEKFMHEAALENTSESRARGGVMTHSQFPISSQILSKVSGIPVTRCKVTYEGSLPFSYFIKFMETGSNCTATITIENILVKTFFLASYAIP